MTKKLLLVAAVVVLMGGKCKGPKAPHAQAADAAEQAFFDVDLDEGESRTVAVDVDDETALVLLDRVDGEVHAEVTLGGERFDFVVAADGEVVPR
jgi:hypothetical protein